MDSHLATDILAAERVRFFLLFIQMLFAKPRFQISSNYLLLPNFDQQHLCISLPTYSNHIDYSCFSQRWKDQIL